MKIHYLTSGFDPRVNVLRDAQYFLHHVSYIISEIAANLYSLRH